ncbi:MAG TPA: hypothetical protein VHS55_05230 [Solirubrobacteraceae bacterium]|nr:hypothetical protein [Solirubrobacteraceae bacterium]
MSAGGVLLPELAAQVDDLARQVEELRSMPQDTIGTTNTYLMKQLFGMNWRGGWDREAAYEPENVVRYKRKAYVNIDPVAAFPAPGLVPPPTGAEAKTRLVNFPQNASGITQYINEGEEIEGYLEPTGIRLVEPYGGVAVAKLYELRVPNGSKLTVPAQSPTLLPPLPYICHYALYDSDGKEFLGNTPEIKEFKVVGGSDPTLFYLVVFAAIEGGPPKPILQPVPFVLNVTCSGGFTNAPGNTPPSEDRSHWALIAGESGGATSSAGSLEVHGSLVLPAGAPGVIAKLSPSIIGWDHSAGAWSAENHRYTASKPGIYSVSVSFQGEETVPVGGWTDVTAAKNGVSVGSIYARNMSSSGSAGPEGGCTGLVSMNGTTDFLELFGGAHTGTGANVKGIATLAIAYVGE